MMKILLRKEVVHLAIILIFAVSFFFGCRTEPQQNFEVSSQGYAFKRCVTHSEATSPKIGDVLVGEITVKLNDTTELFSNYGTPQRLFTINDASSEGSVEEFLLSMHLEDSVIIVIPADSIWPLIPDFNYKQGDKLYCYFKLERIISKHQQSEIETEDEKAIAEEKRKIADYLTRNKLRVEPDSLGMYFIVKKKGEGRLARLGKMVEVYYTVRFLNDSIVQTNVRQVAQEYHLTIPEDYFQSFRFLLGDDGIISAWTEALIRMREGEQSRIIVPSHLAYGKRGTKRIPPYTPLIFDLYLLYVEP